jgi:hypothetical protein
MNPIFVVTPARTTRSLRQLFLVIGLVIGVGLALPTWSSPGAHGPNGEHLDGPVQNAGAAQTAPRFEAQSDTFELVARLQGGELSLLINRYASNEPVLNAEVEVEAGGRKAKAPFHADLGDYAVEDKAMLDALAVPGDHAVVVTILAGADTDLLDGTLVTPADSAAHETDHHGMPGLFARAWLGWPALALVLLIGVVMVRRRKSRHAVVGTTAAALLASLGLLHPPAVHAGPGAHGPNGEHLDAPAAVNASGLARLADGSVNVPMLAQRRMEIRTQLAIESEAAATVELPGRIVMDPNASGRVQAVHGGRIEAGPRGLPVAGQAVRQGEVLAYVRHHAEPYALANQQAQLAELRSGRELAAQRVARLQSLEGTVPRKEIEAARAELQSFTARERSIGASLSARETLLAPVSGVIARADAVLGQIVDARDTLFEVIDPARMLVEATTADPALPARIATARLQSVAGVSLHLLGAARTLRDGVLPLTFRAAADKAGAAMPLAIGQPVVVVAALNERSKGFVLPAQAIVRNAANEPVVWIKSGAERYIPQPVRYRALDATTVLVTNGLGADNRVVVQGAPLIAQIR